MQSRRLARVAAAILPLVPRRLVQVAFAGLSAAHLPEELDLGLEVQYPPADDLPLPLPSVERELYAPNPIGVAAGIEPPEFRAWLLRQQGLPSGE